MKISPLNNNLSFNAKVPLNSKEFLRGNPIADETTILDRVFNESSLVKSLNNLSWRTRIQISKHSKDYKSGRLGNLLGKGIYWLRVMADRLFLLQNRKSIDGVNALLSGIREDSPTYIEELAKIGKTIDSKFMHINTEDKVLDDITDSNESVLFVLNHPNFHKDKLTYLLLNSLLNQMYTAKNIQESCPRPRILVSKNMLKILSKKTGDIYKNLGLLEVDPSLQGIDKTFNVRTMGRILREFVDNKSNLFFFAEGNKSSFLQIPLDERIQTGVAQFVNKALNYKKSVKVVPVGLHYPEEKGCVGNIHLGTPITFSREESGLSLNEKENLSTLNHFKSVEEIFEVIKSALVACAEKAKTQK